MRLSIFFLWILYMCIYYMVWLWWCMVVPMVNVVRFIFCVDGFII